MIDRLLDMAETLRRAEIQAERAKLDDLEARLQNARRDAHELPPQVATLTARIARLEAQTGAEYGVERLRSSVPTAPAAPQPAPPALLDLRTVPRGTVVEMTADALGGMGGLVAEGLRVKIGEAKQASVHVTWDVDGTQCGRWLPCMQPARVVKHACPRCDDGMREIEYVNRVWFSDAVRVEPGTRATIVEWFSARTGKTNMDRSFHVEQVRFVRADVPPPSEWCDGKGVG